MIKFTVPGKAVAKGRARHARMGNHVRTYTPKETVVYENLVKMAAQAAMDGNPPYTAPVRMEVFIHIEPPASWSMKRREEALLGRIRPTKKPDASNVLKSIEDGMNGVVYADDSQIVELTVRKWYGMGHSVLVIVEEVAASAAP